MKQATPQLRDLGRKVLAHEAGRRGKSGDLTEALEQACNHLHNRLALFIGASGFHALLNRALKITKAEFSFLHEVEIADHPSCVLTGSREATKGAEPVQVKEGFAALLGNFIWLLVTFVGEDLALAWVQEVWPEIRLKGAVSGSQRGKNK